ncbi:response regulator [Amaricoccus tamworthensis]|uniref:response regulator n=1 Tax=Amaricoccus tamworthensis TaxID=57002 RepID=UPI003C7CCE3D
MTFEPIKILYAEDEEILQKVVKYSLETFGDFKVETCDDGETAIAAVERFQPDMIILDVMMPGMDGLLAFEEIRKLPNAEGKPIAFMTARIQPDEVEVYRKLGADNVIGKPFDPGELPKIVLEIFKNAISGGPSGSGRIA